MCVAETESFAEVRFCNLNKSLKISELNLILVPFVFEIFGNFFL